MIEREEGRGSERLLSDAEGGTDVLTDLKQDKYLTCAAMIIFPH